MNSENSKTCEPHTLKLKLKDKLDLRLDKKVIALSNLSIYYTWNNIKSSCNNNKFKISAPTWNEEFTLPDGSCSISDIQDYFEYILKKHGENTDKPSIQIYVNKIENRITFKIKNGYSLELNSEYDEIIVWLTDQNSKPLEIEDRINLTIVIK